MARSTTTDGGRWRRAVWGAGAGLLALPAIGMLVSDEMNWGAGDFVLWGAMLGAACGTYELAARMTGSRAYRAGVGVAVAAAFLLVWITLAVGIIGDEGNPANLAFGGVLVVAILGAVFARFRPQGMARALVATAVAQAAVAVLALWAGSVEGLMLTVAFAALWLVAAWLFRSAARVEGVAG